MLHASINIHVVRVGAAPETNIPLQASMNGASGLMYFKGASAGFNEADS